MVSRESDDQVCVSAPPKKRQKSDAVRKDADDSAPPLKKHHHHHHHHKHQHRKHHEEQNEDTGIIPETTERTKPKTKHHKKAEAVGTILDEQQHAAPPDTDDDDDEDLVTAFGISSARCGGAWSQMPRLSQPGDDWVPLGTCRELSMVKTEVDDVLSMLKNARTRKRKAPAAPASGDAAPAPPAALVKEERLPPDIRKDVCRRIKALSRRVGEVRDTANECFSEAVRAQMFRRSNPELLGFGILLQTTSEPPAWARREKTPADRSRKAVATAAAAAAAAAAAPTVAPPPSQFAQSRRTLDAASVLAESLPWRQDMSKKKKL